MVLALRVMTAGSCRCTISARSTPAPSSRGDRLVSKGSSPFGIPHNPSLSRQCCITAVCVGAESKKLFVVLMSNHVFVGDARAYTAVNEINLTVFMCLVSGFLVPRSVV